MPNDGKKKSTFSPIRDLKFRVVAQGGKSLPKGADDSWPTRETKAILDGNVPFNDIESDDYWPEQIV